MVQTHLSVIEKCVKNLPQEDEETKNKVGNADPQNVLGQ